MARRMSWEPPVRRLVRDVLVPLFFRARSVLALTDLVDQLVTQNLGPVPYTQLANITGRPAMSVPLHRTAAGLPLGVQLVGSLGAEGRMLALATQLETARPWFDRYPPV